MYSEVTGDDAESNQEAIGAVIHDHECEKPLFQPNKSSTQAV